MKDYIVEYSLIHKGRMTITAASEDAAEDKVRDMTVSDLTAGADESLDVYVRNEED
jgi:hypothetical protein